MSLLLSIETSTSTCSVAIHEEGNLIQSIQNEVPQSASSQLAVMIHQVLESNNKKPDQLSGIIVAEGPGSYTGLRIGVATAKGICYALQIPLLSINTLELLAHQFHSSFFTNPLSKPDKPEASPFSFGEGSGMRPEVSTTLTAYPKPNMAEAVPSPLERGRGEVGMAEASPSLLERGLGGEALCPLLDARRMEVYCMLLDSTLSILQPTQAKIIDENSFSDQLDKRLIYFFGNGADKCKDIITHPNAHFISGIVLSAAKLGELGFKKYKAALFEDVAHFEPLYLKDFMIKKPNLV
jgi:tRNA threonylcarbamoyladenosine biosynthesis protein TsaB